MSTAAPDHRQMETAAAALLVGTGAETAGLNVPITPAGARIGRVAARNDWVVNHPEVSRSHVAVRLRDDGLAELTDLESTNGTFVNERRTATALLAPGDQVRLGAHPGNSFVFLVPGAAGAERATIALDRSAELRAAALELVEDNRVSASFPLGPQELRLGSAEGGIRIDHPEVAPLHALVRLEPGGKASLADAGSPQGTFVNGRRVDRQTLEDGDLIVLGGCDTRVLLFRAPARAPQNIASFDLRTGDTTLGSSGGNDIQLPHPTVSRWHAILRKDAAGCQLIDRGSTNGTFHNGRRVRGAATLLSGDRIALGAVQFVFDGQGIEQESDGTRVALRARDITFEVPDREAGGMRRILQQISLCLEPRDFVGLLGPSGCGKSTLLAVLNGSQPVRQGNVYLNRYDVYAHYEALRGAIGHVPQDDVLHSGLSVEECLTYAAALRLPGLSEEERAARVAEALRNVGLEQRAGLRVSSLSGGQRKRVSTGIELLSSPGVLFLDEPTAGQDPRTERQLMQLFRSIANRGATVVIATHLLACLGLLTKICVMVRGRIAYFGPSEELLAYFGAGSPDEIYDLLESQPAEDWEARYLASEQYQRSVAEPLAGWRAPGTPAAEQAAGAGPPQASRQRGSFLSQTGVVLARQAGLRFRSARQWASLLAPLAAIAVLLSFLSPLPNDPKVIFMIVITALWFGCSAGVREIVDERAVYRRERRVNLRISSYLAAKTGYLAAVALMQSLVFVTVLTALGAQANHYLEALLLMWALGVQGGLIGLLISAFARTPETALSVFPLALIPQLLLAGLIIPVESTTGFYIETNRQPPLVVSVPPQLNVPPMHPVLRKAVAPLMVSRWGLEALADRYLHDYDLGGALPPAYMYPLAAMIPVTLSTGKPGVELRQYTEGRLRMLDGGAPPPRPATRPAGAAYGAVLAAFFVAMSCATAGALRLQDRDRR